MSDYAQPPKCTVALTGLHGCMAAYEWSYLFVDQVTTCLTGSLYSFHAFDSGLADNVRQRSGLLTQVANLVLSKYLPLSSLSGSCDQYVQQ